VTRVIDATALVAALVDSGADGSWAERELIDDHLAAPHLLPVEVTNILRRAVLAGEVSEDVASLAVADLLALRVELFPFEPLATRVWELRGSITSYDAWYVALAEQLEAPVVTLDRKLSRAPGLRCTFRVPPKEPAEP
jgi:predicted nucleic acid-binding protein